jgi:hypothetical protein
MHKPGANQIFCIEKYRESARFRAGTSIALAKVMKIPKGHRHDPQTKDAGSIHV